MEYSGLVERIVCNERPGGCPIHDFAEFSGDECMVCGGQDSVCQKRVPFSRVEHYVAGSGAVSEVVCAAVAYVRTCAACAKRVAYLASADQLVADSPHSLIAQIGVYGIFERLLRHAFCSRT